MALLRSVLISSSVAAAMMFPADVRADDDARAGASAGQVTRDVDVGDSVSLLALGVLMGGVGLMGVSNIRRPAGREPSR